MVFRSLCIRALAAFNIVILLRSTTTTTTTMIGISIEMESSYVYVYYTNARRSYSLWTKGRLQTARHRDDLLYTYMLLLYL